MLAQVNKPVQVNKTREFHSKKTVTLQYAHYYPSGCLTFIM